MCENPIICNDFEAIKADETMIRGSTQGKGSLERQV